MGSAGVSQCRVMTFDVELIFESDRNAMQGSYCLAFFGIKVIELLCLFQGFLEQNFGKTG